MIVLSGALVLVALVLLVFGALDRNLPYVYASIGVSVLSLLLLLVGILQRRGELVGDDDEAMTPVTDTTAERMPALAGAGAHDADHTTELEVPAAVGGQPPASRRVVPDPAPVDDVPARQADEEDLEDEEDDHLEDEPFDVEDEDVEDEDDGDDLEDEDDVDEDDGDDLEDEDDLDVDEDDGVTVLVVSGRPRYHLEGCRVLRGKQPQALERDDARTHGFSPCGVCKPDADEAPAERRPAAATASTSDDRGVSFTEALFGEPLFADPSSDDADPARAGALPETDPAELHGDDPADEATLRTADEPAPEPAPDVDGDPDEAAREDAVVVDTPVVHSTVVDTTVVDTAVVDTTASTDEQPSPELRADTDSQQVLTGDEAGTEIDGAESAAAPDTSPEEPAPAAVEDVAPVQEPAAEDLLAEEPAERTAPASTARAGDATGTAATRAPAKKAPAKKVPAKRAPAKKAPAKGAPAKRAPAKRAPAKGAPAKGASGTSAKKTAKASPKRAAAPSAAPEAAAPAVRRPVVRAVRADALRLAAPGTGVSTTRVSARGAAPAPAASAPVVVVPDRDRYHRPECRFVRDVADASSLSKAAATREGYAACGVCKP